MKQDIQTILANLAITIAEKEEDIKRLTERVKEQETVVLRGEDIRHHLDKMVRYTHVDNKQRTEEDERTPAELRSDLRFVSEDLTELKEKYDKVAEDYEELRYDYIRKDSELSQVKHHLDQIKRAIADDKFFKIVQSLNRWRKHKIKQSKVFKENMRNRIRNEYERQIWDLSTKARNCEHDASRAIEQFEEMRNQFNTLSKSFNQQLKEKQSHRFQLDDEWVEMTTQELIDFYVSCHPQRVTEGHGVNYIEIPACKSCPRFLSTESKPKPKRKKKSDSEQSI